MSEYRFMFDPRFGGTGDVFAGESVNSKELAEGQLSAVANYTLYLHETSLMVDYTNLGWIEKKVKGMWIVLEEE